MTHSCMHVSPLNACMTFPQLLARLAEQLTDILTSFDDYTALVPGTSTSPLTPSLLLSTTLLSSHHPPSFVFHRFISPTAPIEPNQPCELSARPAPRHSTANKRVCLYHTYFGGTFDRAISLTSLVLYPSCFPRRHRQGHVTAIDKRIGQ